jgi:hypothetical protein
MRNFDFSSSQAVLSTLLGLAIITLLGVGIRLLLMQTVQQRRERANRQINERLRTLIAHPHRGPRGLCNFIRSVLDLDAIDDSVSIPTQGPARPVAAKDGSRGKAGGGMAAGTGAGLGLGVGVGLSGDEEVDHR